MSAAIRKGYFTYGKFTDCESKLRGHPWLHKGGYTAARIKLHLAYNNVSLYVTFKRLLPRVSFCLSMGCLRALTISQTC
ncbi:hypothetical protein AFLA_002342 [Aspergillus flavus NRRL3357]|nr:hypothetical protein AFLA_002342 [Aspergillus flavus NRRL3357]